MDKPKKPKQWKVVYKAILYGVVIVEAPDQRNAKIIAEKLPDDIFIANNMKMKLELMGAVPHTRRGGRRKKKIE